MGSAENLQKDKSAPIRAAKDESGGNSSKTDYPKSQEEYHNRILKAGKQLWKKDPAILSNCPPNFPKLVRIYKQRQPEPKRADNGDVVFPDHPEFLPNLTPEEVLRAGAFGGTYFRPITSAVTNITYVSSEVLADTVKPEWIKGLGPEFLTSEVYSDKINKYGVITGGSLGAWESAGWMADCDPYGWF